MEGTGKSLVNVFVILVVILTGGLYISLAFGSLLHMFSRGTPRPGFVKVYATPPPEAIQFPAVRQGFFPSHVSVSKSLLANVRCVNYVVGKWWWMASQNETINYTGRWDPAQRSFVPGDWTLLAEPSLERRRNVRYLGIEDIRLHPGGGFSGGTQEFCTYTSAHRILFGRCYPNMSDVQVLKPPTEERSMEKNWIFLSNDRFIYSWRPLTVCGVNHQKGETFVVSQQDTPDFYATSRGSTAPVSYAGKLLILTHQRFRRGLFSTFYRHCWNCFDEKTMQLVARSPTFHFFGEAKQAYCLGALLHEEVPGGLAELQLFVNLLDKDVQLFRCPLEAVLKQLRGIGDSFPEDDLDDI